MLEHDRIDVSEEIDVTETNGLGECTTFDYWYFLQINLRFQSEVFHDCHDLMQEAMSFDVAIVSVKRIFDAMVKMKP